MKINDLQAGTKMLSKISKLSIILLILFTIVFSISIVKIYPFTDYSIYLFINKWYGIHFFTIFLLLIVFTMWLYRAYANLKLMASQTRWDPMWTIIGVWVIVANFFMPYILMKEINTISSNKIKKEPKNYYVMIWWLSALIAFIIGFISYDYNIGPITDIDFITGNILYIIQIILIILSNLILINLIISINNNQQEIALDHNVQAIKK